MVSVFHFGVSRLFEFKQNELGLYELRVHAAQPGSTTSIPGFLRPPSAPSGGLERHTSIGNYHGPSIECDFNHQEYLLLDRASAREVRRDLERRNLFFVFR